MVCIWEIVQITDKQLGSVQVLQWESLEYFADELDDQGIYELRWSVLNLVEPESEHCRKLDLQF